MNNLVPTDVIMVDVIMYWIMSCVAILVVDFYAKKKLGKGTLGYKTLGIPKFLSLMTCSGFALLFAILAMSGYQISQNVLTFLGIPFFALSTFFMISVFRRIRAEKGNTS